MGFESFRQIQWESLPLKGRRSACATQKLIREGYANSYDTARLHGGQST